MPRIPDEIRDCVFYLFPSEQAAKVSEGAGGTGFLVATRSTVFDRYFTYAVTCKHILGACGGAPVIRMNGPDGAFWIRKTTETQWHVHADGDDVAAALLKVEGKFAHRFINERLLLTRELIAEHDLGPGDDVFIVGRYVDHEGRARNWPSVRFGNISMMNWEPVRQEGSEFPQESFLVECRSLGGYSGAPVFVYIPPYASRPRESTLVQTPRGPWLLGIDWGHLRIREKVTNRDGEPHPDGWKVSTASGMAAVVPAWKIREVLEHPEFHEVQRLWIKS